MKKFLKVTLIVTGVCTVVGAVVYALYRLNIGDMLDFDEDYDDFDCCGYDSE